MCFLVSRQCQHLFDRSFSRRLRHPKQDVQLLRSVWETQILGIGGFDEQNPWAAMRTGLQKLSLFVDLTRGMHGA
jgi:hypothetical protein